MRDGNQYVLINPYTTEDGRMIQTGAICQYADGYLLGHDITGKHTRFRADLVPDGDVLLYEETPYNKECRERRERIATAAMQGIWSNQLMYSAIVEKINDEQPQGDIGSLIRERIAQLAVAQADALIEELTNKEF